MLKVKLVHDYTKYNEKLEKGIEGVALETPEIQEERSPEDKFVKVKFDGITEVDVLWRGLEIIDVRITHLAYSEEIAAAMLQRQQAEAIIAARQKIVEGAVSMVKMAIDKLSDDGIVDLDEERKAQMVSNLLVVLCGNKDAQPIVNSGSIY